MTTAPLLKTVHESPSIHPSRSIPVSLPSVHEHDYLAPVPRSRAARRPQRRSGVRWSRPVGVPPLGSCKQTAPWPLVFAPPCYTRRARFFPVHCPVAFRANLVRIARPFPPAAARGRVRDDAATDLGSAAYSIRKGETVSYGAQSDGGLSLPSMFMVRTVGCRSHRMTRLATLGDGPTDGAVLLAATVKPLRRPWWKHLAPDEDRVRPAMGSSSQSPFSIPKPVGSPFCHFHAMIGQTTIVVVVPAAGGELRASKTHR